MELRKAGNYIFAMGTAQKLTHVAGVNTVSDSAISKNLAWCCIGSRKHAALPKSPRNPPTTFFPVLKTGLEVLSYSSSERKYQFHSHSVLLIQIRHPGSCVRFTGS
jgi:hypothetical protein